MDLQGKRRSAERSADYRRRCFLRRGFAGEDPGRDAWRVFGASIEFPLEFEVDPGQVNWRWVHRLSVRNYASEACSDLA